ncbi:MAG: histidinol-phosphate transaminase [Gammaproteobacteria bacterium]|nr:histidinol-phosphate transaminase [Gammaproteobacteria bacterium]
MACDYFSLAHSGAQSLQPYQPGKPIEELERELGISDIIKLASNENPLGPAESVRKALLGVMPELSRYPDGNGFLLKQALEQKLKIKASQITLGNGSNDVLDLLARAFAGPGKEVVFSEYAFAVYPIVTLAVNALPVVVPAREWGNDLEAMVEAITSKTALIFLANPNNPTGTYFCKGSFKAFMDKVPERVVVVLDEAYFEYVKKDDYPDGLSYMDSYPNLVVTRTFSKAYGLAGLRVGYGVSNPDIADLLNRVRQPFNVSIPSILAAKTVLNDEAYLQRSIETNRQGLAQLEQGLSHLGLEYIPSVGNFITADFGGDAADINQRLLQSGVIVRPVANYKMPTFLRISVGLAAENERFLTALKRCL